MLQWIHRKKNYLIGRVAISLGVMFVAIFCSLFFTNSTVKAQTAAGPASPIIEGVQVIEQPLGLPATDIRLVVARVINAALGLMGIVLVIIMIYGGFLWMTAGGNDEQIGKAKKVLINAAIGLAIILSAYAIVLIVMRLLGVRSGEDAGPTIAAPGTENFIGSGALGGIVKDHYPMRDQTEVARNTKIAVTFRKPILISSFVRNTNRSTVTVGGSTVERFGDCVTPPGLDLNWERDCDQLILDNDHINILQTTLSLPVRGAVVLANYDSGNKATTIVIKPLDNLGSATEDVQYSVHLGSEIKLDDPTNGNPQAITVAASGNNYYEWRFFTGTALDFDPPKVQRVFPEAESSEPRNSVIQIQFDEAVDPTGIQGQFFTTTTEGAEYYYVQGENIYLKNNDSSVPIGRFEMGNGYTLLEFTPTLRCGTNACGGAIYCLPVCDKAADSGCRRDTFKMLLRAGTTFSATTFEAVPFSGIMDMAGNALDGNDNNRVDRAVRIMPVFPAQEVPDNYIWQFNINNEIDLSSPQIQKITPDINKEWVAAGQDLKIDFNKLMRVDPMYGISIEEQPIHAIPIWRVPRVTYSDSTTTAQILHGAFLDGIRQFYFPVVPSSVEDVHFNCLYPGKGPKLDATEATTVCDGTKEYCCPVTTSTPNRAVCCNSTVDERYGDSASCINYLRSESRL